MCNYVNIPVTRIYCLLIFLKFRNFSLRLWYMPHVHAAKVQHMLLLSSYMFSSWGRDSVTRIMGLQLSAASRICHPWNIQSKFHTQVPQNVWTPATNFQESLEANETSSLKIPIRMLESLGKKSIVFIIWLQFFCTIQL